MIIHRCFFTSYGYKIKNKLSGTLKWELCTNAEKLYKINRAYLDGLLGFLPLHWLNKCYEAVNGFVFRFVQDIKNPPNNTVGGDQIIGIKILYKTFLCHIGDINCFITTGIQFLFGFFKSL